MAIRWRPGSLLPDLQAGPESLLVSAMEFYITVDFEQNEPCDYDRGATAALLGDKIADMTAASGSKAKTAYDGDAEAWAAVIATDNGSVVTASQKFETSAAPETPQLRKLWTCPPLRNWSRKARA